MSFELKINVRHSDTGRLVRSITRFTRLSLSLKFNSLASTFEFDFYFDPKNKEIAETVCVSHMHECSIWHNGTQELGGIILNQNFVDTGVPGIAKISGYSKPGVLNDSDTPKELYPLEINGLSFKNIINKFVRPFNLSLQIDKNTSNLNKAFIVKDTGGDTDSEGYIPSKSTGEKIDENMGKTASETAQNVGAYLTELSTQMNVPMSHTATGAIWITNAKTKGTPILNFDFTSNDPNNDAKKIPGLKCELNFNGQGLHTHIRVVQQADDEEGVNASEFTIRNPLIPIKKSVIFRNKTVVVNSGNQFTVQEVAKYELGKEIRENVTLKISMAKVNIDSELIRPNNTITIRNPSIFLYTTSTWFIESVDLDVTPQSETAVLNCVLPYGYDFDYATLKNVFVDAHKNLPEF